MKGAAPVKIVADRPSQGAPRHLCGRHAPLRSLGYGLAQAKRAKRRAAQSDGRCPGGRRSEASGWRHPPGSLGRHMRPGCNPSLPGSSSFPPVEHGAGMPSAGPGAPPKQYVYAANLPQLQAAPALPPA